MEISEATSGILIFLGIAITCSLLSHLVIKRISLAILLAAISSALIFQVVVYVLAGYRDPFYIIALITTFIFAFFIALLISIPFKIWRRTGNEKQNSAT